MQTTFKLKMNAPYLYVRLTFITGRNEVVAKVMFYRCVSVHRGEGGGCLPQCMLGCQTPPGPDRSPRIRQTSPRPGRPPWISQTPPRTRQTPPDQPDPPDQADPPGPARPPGPGRHPPRTRQTPPGSRLQHTVYERQVRILLECILVRCAMTIPNSPEKPLII